MSVQTLSKRERALPSIFSDYFKPWNEWFDGDIWNKTVNVPAVNITENDKEYKLSLAAPGLKKDDFKINIEGNMLTIRSEKEEKKETKEEKYSCKEYNYSSFSRSFTLPDDVNQEKIEANYQDGILNVSLPRNEKDKKAKNKSISIK